MPRLEPGNEATNIRRVSMQCFEPAIKISNVHISTGVSSFSSVHCRNEIVNVTTNVVISCHRYHYIGSDVHYFSRTSCMFSLHMQEVLL